MHVCVRLKICMLINDVRVEVVTYTCKLSVPSLNASGPMVCIGLSDKIL